MTTVTTSLPPLLRRLVQLAVGVLLVIAIGAGALWAVLRIALAPAAGEWATEIGRGPFALQASVPQLVWLATTPWIGERLHGVRVATRLGPVTLGWEPDSPSNPAPALVLHCEPCSVPLPAGVGQPALTLPAAQLTLSRTLTAQNDQALDGLLLLGARALAPDAEAPLLTAHWQARRAGPGWAVRLNWGEHPVRDWLALLAPQLPELARARIDGTLALSADLQLPERTLQLAPVLQGVSVQGLGTEAWAHLHSSCGPRVAVDARGWLARAVLAAEDQRFDEHPGYDLEELLTTLHTNQQRGAIARGGSTLTQQLAKLMVTGGERTLARKLREWLYAVEMEQTLGKARILQLYLNLAPWGETAEGRLVCGAEAAARHHFNVPAQRLSPRQAITLAAMLQNPTRGAERWASEGSVDPERLVWIADQIRGVPVRQRRALAAQLRAEQAVVAAASIRSLSVAGAAPHASTVRLAGAAVR